MLRVGCSQERSRASINEPDSGGRGVQSGPTSHTVPAAREGATWEISARLGIAF
jgi:hypothetical protein